MVVVEKKMPSSVIGFNGTIFQYLDARPFKRLQLSVDKEDETINTSSLLL